MKTHGVVGWFDLTVENAEQVSDFYHQVVGWEKSEQPMENGEYADFCMMPPESEEPITGVCHKRGVNQELPSQWLIYINVPDLKKCIQKCEELGGKIVSGPRDMGSYGKMCVIQDPAGAVAALIEPK